MKPWRRAGVVLGAGLLLAGTAHEVVTGSEHWPLSPYPMFSELETADRIERLRLVGERADGRQVALRDDDLLAPMGEARLRAAFRRLAADPPARRRALSAIARRYEERRAAGEHQGPPLVALNLERWTWRLEPGGAPPLRLVERRRIASHPSDPSAAEPPTPTRPP